MHSELIQQTHFSEELLTTGIDQQQQQRVCVVCGDNDATVYFKGKYVCSKCIDLMREMYNVSV